MLSVQPLPRAAAGYRWYYLDATCGEFTVVCIFMLGAVFSARSLRREQQGLDFLARAAVNVAIYQGGRRRVWVFSDYPQVAHCSPDLLRIGASTLHYHSDGTIEVSIDEVAAPQPAPVSMRLRFLPSVAAHPPITLAADLPHYWQPLAVCARVEWQWEGLPQAGRASGYGYHDSNYGDEPLGPRLEGWQWQRVHHQNGTEVLYLMRDRALLLRAQQAAIDVQEIPAAVAPPTRWTAWGLKVPRRLSSQLAQPLAKPVLIESAPFYARLEAHSPQVHALAEVADFARFRRPWCAWMANYRSRAGA